MNKQNIVNDTQEYVTSAIIVASERNSWCNAIEFYNAGTTTAYINNRTLPAGAAWSPASDVGDKDNTQYLLRFDTGGSPSVLVTRKIYVQ